MNNFRTESKELKNPLPRDERKLKRVTAKHLLLTSVQIFERIGIELVEDKRSLILCELGSVKNI